MKYTILILAFIQALYGNHCLAQNFFPLPPGFNHEVRSLFYDSTDNELYAGGNFWALQGGTPMRGISKWNGSVWDSLSGLSGYVYSITKYNGQIYAGGNFLIFDSVGNFTYPSIAYWNGIMWNSPPGGGTNSVIWILKTIGNDLFAGGLFDSIGGIAAKNFARFDGSLWHSYPTLAGANGITAIEYYNGELYIGGDFSGANGKKDIAKWDGTNWVSVGGGFSGPNSWLHCMTVYQGNLYVGGYFLTNQGDPGNNIAIWNGTSWSQPGNGLMPANVYAMHEFNNELYAGGQINNASGVSVTYIAKWNGNSWSSTGGIFSNGVDCFSSSANSLYLGGAFITINGDTMITVAGYSPTLGINQIQDETSEMEIYPNPFTEKLNVSHLKIGEQANIVIYDLMGETVYQQELSLNNTSAALNLSFLQQGVYFLNVKNDGESWTRKIVKM